MQTAHFWIGKDLSRATDEVDFYETARKLAVAEGRAHNVEELKFNVTSFLDRNQLSCSGRQETASEFARKRQWEWQEIRK